jgi:hypothetical protein
VEPGEPSSSAPTSAQSSGLKLYVPFHAQSGPPSRGEGSVPASNKHRREHL